MVQIIESAGDNLVMNIDGSRILFYPTNAGVWKCSLAADIVIKAVGNQLRIQTLTSGFWAVPTTSRTWVVNANFTPPDPDPGPDPEPSGGDFSWPYEPRTGHWVTSEFGPRNGRFHEGIDLSGGPALYGKPIPAIGDGVVKQSGYNNAFGYSVILNHGALSDGFVYCSLYAHQPADAPRPAVGASVNKGATIGQVNNTGSSQGSHLHMEIHKTVGGNMKWDTANPSYGSSRTAINPRAFFDQYGDGTWIIS